MDASHHFAIAIHNRQMQSLGIGRDLRDSRRNISDFLHIRTGPQWRIIENVQPQAANTREPQ